jgi:hypothetical protein
MTLAIIIGLGALLLLIAGYSARQMQELRENAETMAELRTENEKQRVEIKDLHANYNATIEDLRAENVALQRDSAAHVSNLEMVLGHTDDQSA